MPTYKNFIRWNRDNSDVGEQRVRLLTQDVTYETPHQTDMFTIPAKSIVTMGGFWLKQTFNGPGITGAAIELNTPTTDPWGFRLGSQTNVFVVPTTDPFFDIAFHNGPVYFPTERVLQHWVEWYGGTPNQGEGTWYLLLMEAME